mgnify:CR=1 FL=1
MTNHNNEALQLEITILEALLKRNRSSQGRTKYYQRCSMVLRAILRTQLMELKPTTQALKDSLAAAANVPQISHNKRRRQRQQSNSGGDADQHWDWKSLQKEETTLGNKCNDTDILEKEQRDTIQFIGKTIHQDFPEILSRIEYASQALFWEIARGFFLPFCTVAVGALARIRVLVMRLGHLVVEDMQEIQSYIIKITRNQTEDLWLLSNAQLAELRNLFTEITDEERGFVNREERTRQLRQSLGIPTRSNKKNIILSNLEDDDSHDEDAHQNDEVITMDVEKMNSNSNNSSNPSSSAAMVPSTSHAGFGNDDIGQAVLTSQEREAELLTRHSDNKVQPMQQQSSTTDACMKDRLKDLSAMKKKKGKGKAETSSTAKKKDTKAAATYASTSNVDSTPKDIASKKRAVSPTESKPKKKKKKQSKKDFFDNLFD